MNEKPESVANLLERERELVIREWLRRVNLLPVFTYVSISDEDRVFHLPKLFDDLACRLRLPEGAHLPISDAANAHGRTRRAQGYSAAMLVEESRLFEVVIFQTLHRLRDELDLDQLLLDVIVIADEANLQLMQAVRCCCETQIAASWLPPWLFRPRSGDEIV
jgi:hypothetical protein